MRYLLRKSIPAFIAASAMSAQGVPSPEEQIIFELLLPKDTKSFRVRPKLEAYESEDPRSLWATLCRSRRGVRTPGLTVLQYRTAYNNLIQKLNTHRTLTQWNDSILVRDESTNADEKTQSIIWFSRIGFNDHHTLAIVYSGSYFGPLAGTGEYYFLRKSGRNWIVAGKIMMWIS